MGADELVHFLLARAGTTVSEDPGQGIVKFLLIVELLDFHILVLLVVFIRLPR
jgi:hypothetical protein